MALLQDSQGNVPFTEYDHWENILSKWTYYYLFLVFSKTQIAAQHPLSEECRVAVNHTASYELHVSDAHLSIACYYIEGPEEPSFAILCKSSWGEGGNGKQFIGYLRKCERKICLPVTKRPEIDNEGNSKQALGSALELENEWTKILLDVKTESSANNNTNVLCFMEKYLEEQKDNTNYPQCQLVYHQELEMQAQKEEDPLKKPVDLLGK